MRKTHKMALITIFILFCAFQLNQIQNVSSSKKSPFIIDDFINQLMKSNKFSELTDIIAEKAADKIKSVQQHKKQEHSSEKEFSKTDKIPIENSEYETVKTSDKSKKGGSSIKFGKINTDAFLKKDLRQGEISLNYKHMTDKLKRRHHKKNKRNGGKLSDGDSKIIRDKHAEKPSKHHQSRENKMHPRKQLKTNKVYEEIQRNFNKINKSMDEDSSSLETKHNKVNNTSNDETSEEHEIFIKTDDDVVRQVNVKKGSDEENVVEAKSTKKPKKSNENIDKSAKAARTLEISNKELEEQDKSIQISDRSSENVKKYHKSNNEQENQAQVTESSENSIEKYTKYESFNEKKADDFKVNLKKNPKSIKHQEDTNEKLEIRAKSVEDLLEMQNEQKTQNDNSKKNENIQNNKRPKPHKGTPKFKVQKSEATPKAEQKGEKTLEISNKELKENEKSIQTPARSSENVKKYHEKTEQTTEHVEDYSDVNSENAKEILLKEPILQVPYPVIGPEKGKIYTHNFSNPDYNEYHDQFVSKGNFISS